MSSANIRLAMLLVAVCTLVGLNIAASALQVPLVVATIADVLAALTALVGLLVKQEPPNQ